MFGLASKDSGAALRGVFEAQRGGMRSEVESLDANRLLNTSPTDLAAYLAQKYSIHPVVLDREHWSVAEREAQIDVSQDPNRFLFDRPAGPHYIPGQRVAVEIPFEGDRELFFCQPSTFSMSPPIGQVGGSAPVRERSDAPKTYAVPDVRRKSAPSLSPATSTPFEPEPAWAMEHYEHAVQVLQNMALVMERTPSAYSKMEEEHLRDQFLVQLNA